MAPPTKGKDSKSPRSEGILEFMIVDTIPKDLWRWWTDMGSYEQRRVNFMGKGSSVRGAELRNKKPIIPKNVDAKKFLELLKINQIENESLKNGWVSLDFLYERYSQNGKDVICMSSGISFLVLIGLRGVQPYAPLRVMRQLARVQEIPPNDDMSSLYLTPRQQDKGKVVPGYLSWFRDPVTFGDISEGSSRKRKDQHIIRQLEKELEKAKATIARQEVQVQRGRNHQLELQDVEGELKHTEGKISRLEEELDSTIHLAHQIKKEQSFEISRLKRDLVASKELVQYQKGELKLQKEKFEKERSC
ncbi:hypothetical protein KY290_005106 [Solanum tuberosum]|uniref:Uncharacterized protein n=1 Tax=Solanum tuberosum TaxID=4113 RepID=A0ABQ7W230_SOLTU|nr:hypothetical protein KY284_034806 [Solanum tuberosum]KAH0710426.1 hypothetical protein KY284_011853 [Solanum tuberosum]KAH0722452.1 hypothetical protein KY289_005496 [Solanum tuberosum]KAH0774635.1 hypothetical protein KY290_011772 [Solanum tuberosum]KAH0778679.1 hypothetical protein KY290_005106 [Solanum tuberosum]